MHKSARQKIVRFIIDNDLFPELIDNNYFDDDLDDDMLYGDLYLLKKQSLVYGLDLNKIKESHTLEEYKNNIKREFLKIPSDHVKLDDWYWSRFYNKRGVLIDFINSLDIKDFDIHVPAFGWFEDKELH